MVEPTLEFIAQQLERILSEQRLMRAEMRDLGRRVTSIEAAMGLIFSQIATLNNRLDRIEDGR